MIKTARIQNFQAHRNTLLEFVPGINVISGASHTGKSSILRALFWLITNRPSGDEFRSWFASPREATAVTMELHKEEGEGSDVIVRHKTSTVNGYKLNEHSFKAIRTDIPEEVRTVLHLEEQNLQEQHQSYYLLMENAEGKGEAVASAINRFCNLEIIDVALEEASQQVGRAQFSVRTTQHHIAAVEESLERYKNLPKLEERTAVLVAIQTRHEHGQKRLTALSALRVQIQEGEEDLATSRDWLRVQERSPALIALQAHVVDQRRRLTTLIPLLKTMTEDHQTIQSCAEWVRLLPIAVGLQKQVERIRALKLSVNSIGYLTADLSATAAGLERTRRVMGYRQLHDLLRQHIERIRTQREKRARLHSLLNAIRLGNEELETTKQKAQSLQAEYQKLWSTMPICPLCGATTHQSGC